MKNYYKKSAFTLIELLTVIAIIGILAAIIIPTVGSVKVAANKAKTKSQFGQWSVAMGLFKSEYGYYPAVAASDASSGLVDTTAFLANLTARNHLGALQTGASLKGNKKALSFYSVADSELLKSGEIVQNVLIDAFSNADIAVMVDANGDGVITDAEIITDRLEGGNDVDGTSAALTSGAVDASNIRAGVAFYSAGRNSSINDYVYSWK
jgi:prepilin-type N-terminal cleavage/methylation domain-containing protein